MSTDATIHPPGERLWQAIVDLHPYRLTRALADGADPNAARAGDETGTTPLGYLICAHSSPDAHSRKKFQDMVVMLLDRGADPTRPSRGEFPYQAVTRLNHPAVHEKLFVALLRGLDKTRIDTEVAAPGMTPMSALAHAFRSRNCGRARELMQRGADPWKPLTDGQPCWVQLGRTNCKPIDRHRNPYPAKMMREIAGTRPAADVLDVVALEAELLEEGSTRRDSYGRWAMDLVQKWMLETGDLDPIQVQRLAKCAGRHFQVPGAALLAAGLDPGFVLPGGITVAWSLLESEDAQAARVLLERQDWDMTINSPKGETLADFLRKAQWLDVEKKTREKWISRVQAQLLDKEVAHPTPGHKPHQRRL